jgi:hypothetical protein
MKKSKKLKLTNWSLLATMALTLVVSIVLEATHCRSAVLVWVHVVVATLAVLLAFYHIELHFGLSGWIKKFSKQKSVVTRILWWLFALLTLSGIAALCHWLATGEHGVVGGVHGKIGFVMVAVALGHAIKRRRYFKG